LKHEKALFSWSGGKDSSLALYELTCNKRFEKFEITALLTTLTTDYNRISMHGVRRELLLAQSRSMGIPAEEVWIPANASNEIYQSQSIKSVMKWKEKEGISNIMFGDLFLEDIRAYREKFLGQVGIECIFPLWMKNTNELAKIFVDSGFKAVICTVDPKKLNPKFCGREFDDKFLSDIPNGVDACGENGEFHTFVFGGPIFKEEIKVKIGDIIERDGFYFADMQEKSA
jgi:uncharacterized protein (TIGR00290 family)